jgi:short-subunit dehydrogenase
MELDGTRWIVAGATGVLGGELARGLVDRGARVVPLGRDREKLDTAREALGAPVAVLADVTDPAAVAAAVDEAASALGGLDGLVSTVGVPAFGPARDDASDTVTALFAINALGPMTLARAALARFGEAGALVLVSAAIAEHPTAGLAAYSSAKAALSAWTQAARRELRRDGVTVLEARPHHMETGFAEKALTGAPPPVRDALDPREVAAAVLDALAAGRREVAYDIKARELAVR